MDFPLCLTPSGPSLQTPAPLGPGLPWDMPQMKETFSSSLYARTRLSPVFCCTSLFQWLRTFSELPKILLVLLVIIKHRKHTNAVWIVCKCFFSPPWTGCWPSGGKWLCVVLLQARSLMLKWLHNWLHCSEDHTRLNAESIWSDSSTLFIYFFNLCFSGLHLPCIMINKSIDEVVLGNTDAVSNEIAATA